MCENVWQIRQIFVLRHRLKMCDFLYELPINFYVSVKFSVAPMVQVLTLGRSWSWWRHHMGTFSALPTLCEGNPRVTGGFRSQRPLTRSFDVLFDLRLNIRLSKHSRRWWFETPPRLLWRLCNDNHVLWCKYLSPDLGELKYFAVTLSYDLVSV